MTLTMTFDYLATLEPRLVGLPEFARARGLSCTDGVDWREWLQVKKRLVPLVGFHRQPTPRVEPEAVSVPLGEDLSVATLDDALDLAARRRRRAKPSEIEDELSSTEAYGVVYRHLLDVFETAVASRAAGCNGNQ